MDYEKMYRGALKRAKAVLEIAANKEEAEGYVSTIFPELKESEDERIRKELIEHCKNQAEPYIDTGNEYPQIQSWIDWLEKQGKQPCNVSPIDDFATEFEKQVSYLIASSINKENDYTADYVKWVSNALLNYAKQEIENQGELPHWKKSTLPNNNATGFNSDYFTYNGYYINYKELFNKLPKDDFEKQGANSATITKGNNSVTNAEVVSHYPTVTDSTIIEPKFKVGDWIIDKQGITHQIKNVIENVTNHTFGYDLVGGGYFNEETEGVRLWTIEDAKDGDVLTESDVILMFRGIGNTKWDDVVDYHCYYDCYREVFIVQEDLDHWDNTEGAQLKPATKEQCDFLFLKMKEAGYEWDAEKKELKLLITNGGDFDTENCEQNPACSEDDEEIIGKIRHIISEYDKITKKANEPCWYIGDCLLWLQDIELKGLPQSKQEWSNEDEEEFMSLIGFLSYNGMYDSIKFLRNKLKNMSCE